ncbi:hypothetical protein CLNEO_05300 [Anaerotignum neopropionicum]|uniref:DNA replication protein n=1 Tax=Anaerotignum neopropionicum TaxID=36847 RepID=A0A136WIY8_9FIRM|nr:replisome organizer [Anaerotignum neopropionicum]KXL54424.1 hypothetical protein CLNEO_05300 [Anaerotignum neopropionicum]
MAQKRMFTMHILDSDAFLDMPLSSQCLYLHLNMRADDDGFIGNPKRIQRMIGASDDDLKILIAKRFVLVFDDGVIVIKHWKMHNTIQGDRYTPTVYQEEVSRLLIKGNKSYSFDDRNKMFPECKQNDNTGLGLGLGLGLDKGLKESSKKRTVFTPPTIEQVKEYCTERKNSVDAERFIDFYACKGWMVGKNKMKDWKAAVRNWERGDSGGRSGASSKPKESDNSKYNGMVL